MCTFSGGACSPGRATHGRHHEACGLLDAVDRFDPVDDDELASHLDFVIEDVRRMESAVQPLFFLSLDSLWTWDECKVFEARHCLQQEEHDSRSEDYGRRSKEGGKVAY